MKFVHRLFNRTDLSFLKIPNLFHSVGDTEFLNQYLHKLFDDDNLHVRTDGRLHPSLNLVEM